MNLIEEQREELGSLLQKQAFSLFGACPTGHRGGPKVQKLESLFCDYFEVRHAIAMNSATSALHAACIVGNVHRTLVPVVTFSATASAVLMAGGKPVFTDIDPETYNMKLTCDAVDSIIPVHLHGNPCPIQTQGEFVIEDCSQAIGAKCQGKKVGTIGNCGIFSFNQGKIIQCGEGGMLITNDDEIADKVRLIRNHGETQSMTMGYNYRMTELQAAVLIPQMKRLDELLEWKITLAECLTEELKDIPELVPPKVQPGDTHVYCTYPVRVKGINRDELQKSLIERGVYFGEGGYKPLNRLPFYGDKGYYPNAEDAYQTIMYTNIVKPPLLIKDVREIASKIEESLCEGSRLKPIALG